MADQANRATITLNGEPYTIGDDSRLLALIEKLDMRPTRIAVEINHEVVPRARYAEVALKPGDQVEIINFVGGG